MAEQTPIPAEALEAAAKVALRRYESEHSVSPEVTWQSFVAEIHEFVEAAAPVLLAAGRTAAAADPTGADVDLSIAEGRLAAVGEVADWLGSLRGRTDAGQVYADLAELKLRTALGEHKPDGPCSCPACPGAARVAENGADHAQ